MSFESTVRAHQGPNSNFSYTDTCSNKEATSSSSPSSVHLFDDINKDANVISYLDGIEGMPGDDGTHAAGAAGHKVLEEGLRGGFVLTCVLAHLDTEKTLAKRMKGSVWLGVETLLFTRRSRSKVCAT